MSVTWEVIGWGSAALLVVAYLLIATHVISAHRPVYHVLNLVGGIGLTAYSLYKAAWPNAVLNVFWAVVAVVGIAMAYRAARSMRGAGAPPSESSDEEPVREG